MKPNASVWTNGHGYQSGDSVTIIRPDPRAWKRFLHWVTFRQPPTITVRLRVTAVGGSSLEWES